MNRMDEALQHVQKGVYYLQWWPSHNHITTAYILMGKVLLAMGRLDEAAEAIGRAEQEQHKGQVMPVVLRLVEYVSILLWLQRGDWDLLDRWLAAQEPVVPAAVTKTACTTSMRAASVVAGARLDCEGQKRRGRVV
jgi:ATP/maltotriose-dependent transcriptional regulator MalT